jgi:hypothetical protein
MYSLPIALILAQGAAQEARSALPGAPVMPTSTGSQPCAPVRRSRVDCATWPTS